LRASNIRFLLALSLALGVITACAGGTSSGSGTHPTKPLVIGFIADFSGVGAFYGPEGKNVAQLAVDDINKAGGVFGRPVRLAIGDAASNPQQELSEGQRLVKGDFGQIARVPRPRRGCCRFQ